MERILLLIVLNLIGFLGVGCGTTTTKQKAPISSCDTLQQCLELLETIEVDKYGIDKDEEVFAKSFTRFGEPALKALLQRLDIGDNRDKIVGYAIASFDPIDEKYLPQILEGVKQGVPWLARALGNIPSEKGAKIAVDAYMASNSAPHNQEAYAVERQGKRAVPYIVQRMQCGEYCEGVRQDLLVHIIGEMDDDAKDYASTEIVKRLFDPAISRANQANLLGLFFQMGAPGLVAESDLERLSQGFPKLSPLIDQAYVGIHSKHSGRVFGKWIAESPENLFVLRDASALGPAAAAAGPAIMPLLSSEDSEIQVGAARALGFLQYAPAEQALIKLFEDSRNIQLDWAAVNSLGRIGLRSSIPVLDKVAKAHWYPAVRDEAKFAIKQINQGKNYESDFHKNNFAFDFFSYQHLDVKSCKKVTLERVTIDSSQKLTRQRDADALEGLSYASYIISYTAGDEEEQKADDPDAIIVVNQSNIVEVREQVQKTPNVAVRVANGWLTGYDGGEWGGELMFRPDLGEPQELLNRNVDDIFKLGDAYIAVVGLAHMSMNEGMVYRIYKEADRWRAEPWITLPGAPKYSWLTVTGEILIDTYSGGTILLSEDGSLSMASCNGYEED